MAAGSRKVIIAAFIGNSLIAVTKFIAGALTGSSAMFSEGIHSLVDTGNQVLLLYGLKRAQQPADERFPFGHGKEIYFWSFVVAILIFAVGAGVSLYEGLHRLSAPAPIRNPLVNYLVLGLALLFEGGAWWLAFREFGRAKGHRSYLDAVRRGKDPTLFMVLFEDTAALLGLLVALLALALSQWTGLLWLDGAASIIIGLILGLTAVLLAYETKGLLIGEAADPGVVSGIRALAESGSGVQHVNEVLTMHMGPQFILVNLSLDFADHHSAAELETAIARLDAEIKSRYPQVQRVFIEAEARRQAAP